MHFKVTSLADLLDGIALASYQRVENDAFVRNTIGSLEKNRTLTFVLESYTSVYCDGADGRNEMSKQDEMINPEDVKPKNLEYGETQPPRGDVQEQRGGPQDNQRTGQTEKGSRNNEARGRNPQGNPEERWNR